MGIFFNTNEIKSLHEFEVDGKKSEETNEEDYKMNTDGENGGDTNDKSNEADDNNDQPKVGDDGAKEEDYDMNTENEEDENEEEDNEEDDQPKVGDDGAKEEDYMLDSEEDEDNTDDDNQEDENDSMDDSSGEERDSKLKELEGELFDTLSPEQKQIKIDELKRCYQELYSRCDNIIDMINNGTSPDENTSRVFEYINDNMSDLKQYIYDYFTYTFDTKPYLENDAQYRKYIAILNSFNSILEPLIKNKESEEK